MISSLDQLSALAVVKLSEMPSQVGETSEYKKETTATESDSKLICQDQPDKSCNMTTQNNISFRHPSTISGPTARCQEWSRQITMDERKYIREKIKAAYVKKMDNSFEDLLETCAAIEEELVFSSAPSRLDYFKSGVQFEKRVAEKRTELMNVADNVSTISSEVHDPSQPKPIKRAKTNH